MGDLILAAGLFTGEAVEEFVVFNKDEVEAQGAEPRGAYFDLLPIDGKLDAEYTKRRGQDVQKLRMKPSRDEEKGQSRVEFDAMELSFSNEREIGANVWLAKQVVKGWRGIKLDNGRDLEFSPHNLEKLASIPIFIRPVLERCYELGRLREQFKEGN